LPKFVYLLLTNSKIRHVIDTLTAKVVLILGRFTPARKAVLDALRERLRELNYLPILFDFDVPSSRDFTETVRLIAQMSRFIIADLTDASSIPKELEAITPSLAVPIQPLIEGTNRPYSMFADHWKYDWVLELCRFDDQLQLIKQLSAMVIDPAEAKVAELATRRGNSSYSSGLLPLYSPSRARPGSCCLVERGRYGGVGSVGDRLY
jgi:hypothetical protein